MRFASYILSAGLMLYGGQTLADAQISEQGQVQTRASSQTQKTPDPSTQFSIEDYNDLTLPSKTPPARLQKGQRTNKLETLAGLDFKRFARRLGEISSISRGAKGQLYTTDTQSGRVFVIPDRDQNSRPEQIRPLPYRFDAPSAAIEVDGNLYVVDRKAIWKIPLRGISSGPTPEGRVSGQAPIRLANLQNTQSTGRYFLMPQKTAPEEPADLILGYSAQDGKARLISVDINTGRAQLIDETNGELTQLIAAPSGAKPWVVYRNQDGLHIGTEFDNAVNLGQNLTINGIALPRSDITANDWPQSLRDHIFISQANPVSVSALPTSLGIVLPRGRDVFTGFQNGRTAWAKAGALHMDTRGLFIADPYNGDLWLIQPQPKAAKIISKNRLEIALDKVKTAEKQDESPLKRNPLDGIYDSLIPDPDAPKDDKNTKEKPNQTKPSQDPPR